MNEYPNTLDELVADMELNPDKYKHLQFILNRQKHINLGLGQLYLVVNNVGFGLYRLEDVDYSEGLILMSFTNPQVFLVNWRDIEDMVYSEVTSNYTDHELQELENELP